MVRCGQCGFENEPAAACARCSAPLPLSSRLAEVCEACDAYNEPGAAACLACGKPLAPDTAAGAAGRLEGKRAPAAVLPIEAPGAASGPELAPKSAASEVTELEVRPAGRPTPDAAPPSPLLSPDALPPGWTAPVIRDPTPAASLACGSCGALNPTRARYCTSCGQPLRPPTDSAKAQARLVVVEGTLGEGRSFELGPNPSGAGSGPVPVALAGDPFVSALQATFFFQGPQLYVRDEAAPNGIFLRLREPAWVRPGDVFVVGQRHLRFAGVLPVTIRSPALHGGPVAMDRMIVVEELLDGGGIGRVCRRAAAKLTVGRTGCDLTFPKDTGLSVHHAELSLLGEAAVLQDMEDTSGTYLRMGTREARPLRDGDSVLMGREVLRVEMLKAA